MTKQPTQWEIYDSLEVYYQKVSEKIIMLLSEAIKRNHFAVIGLSGGTTPGPVYSRLIQTESSATIPWDRVFLIWADERFVSHDSSESNYKLVRNTLLSTSTNTNIIPEQNIYPISIIVNNPQKTLQEYELKLKELFAKIGRPRPFIDITILGMGTDGHTASLFPDIEELSMLDKYNWVITPYVRKLNSYRVSLTPKLLNTSTTILFLVTGEKKALLVKKIFAGNTDLPYPIELIQPDNGKIIWLLDAEAAKELKK